MAERRPAFYAATGRAGEWWTLLHPPYTAWHLAYVAIGAALAPHLDAERLVATLVAFFLAVGIAATATAYWVTDLPKILPLAVGLVLVGALLARRKSAVPGA